MMNYLWYHYDREDGSVAYGITQTDFEVNDLDTFATFSKARTALVAELETLALNFHNAADGARSLAMSDVEKLDND